MSVMHLRFARAAVRNGSRWRPQLHSHFPLLHYSTALPGTFALSVGASAQPFSTRGRESSSTRLHKHQVINLDRFREERQRKQGSKDNPLRVFSLRSPKGRQVPLPHSAYVESKAFTPEGLFWRVRGEGGKLTHPQLHEALMALAAHAHVKGMLEILRLAEWEDALLPDSRAFEHVLCGYGMAGDPQGMMMMLSLVARKNLPVTSVMVDAVLMGFARAGDPMGACEAVKELQRLKARDRRLTSPHVMMAEILRLFAKRRDYEGAMAVFAHFQNKVFESQLAYNAMFLAFARCGLVDFCMALLADMRDADRQPDRDTYCSIIMALQTRFEMDRQAVQAQEAQEAAEGGINGSGSSSGGGSSAGESDVEGLALEPGGEQTLLTKEQALNATARLVKHMEAQPLGKYEPSPLPYSYLVHAYFVYGEPEEAVAVLDRLQLQGLAADVGLYSKLLMGLSQDRRRGMEVHRRMEAEGVPMGTKCYNSVIKMQALPDAVDGSRDVPGALLALTSMLDAAQTNPDHVRPDILSFQTLANTALYTQDGPLAVQLVGLLEGAGVIPDKELEFALLHCLARNTPKGARFSDLQRRVKSLRT